MLRANEYQYLAARTIRKDISNADMVSHALFGMASEIGEICGIYQKFYQGHTIDELHLKKECGDLMWFIAEYCTAQGWDLEEIMEMNIKKLRARFPEGFEIDKSLYREEGDI